MQRHFINIQGEDMHLRICGKGFPLVLFHASPSSSGMFEAFSAVLKDHFTLIMPDTPGYGLSDPLPMQSGKIGEYVPSFRRVFNHLGLKKFAIYGTATGAQLGIRYALSYPEQVQHLFLDNAAHFTHEQFTAIKGHYFPDLTPVYDGSHLTRMWTFIRDMFRFFPWFMRGEDNKLNMPPLPPIVYDKVAMDFLQAGADYHMAYMAAFKHEHAKNLQGLRVKSTIFKHTASIVLPYIEQLIAHPFSAELIKVLDTPAAPGDRYALMRSHMTSVLPTVPEAFSLNLKPKWQSRQMLVEIEGKYIHAFVKVKGEGMPLAWVAGPAESASIWESQMKELIGERAGVILSLPGQGDSDDWGKKLSEEEEEELIAQVMRKLGFPSFELKKIPSSIPDIKIDETDPYGIYMKKAWINLREQYDGPTERLQLILREKLKYRA